MQDLGETERRRLVERFGRSYASGAVIYAEGAPADGCFLLHQGRVRLVKRLRSMERSMTILKPGDLFGEDALLRRERLVRTATAVALTDVVVLGLDQRTLGLLLSGNPDVANRVVVQLVERLAAAEEQVENAMLKDHPSRILNTLLRLVAAEKPQAEGYVLHVSPLELSARVGLDVDAVKRTVQQLRDGGYLRIAEERIVIPDLEAVAQLYELLGSKEEIRG